jgi:hypothetical protein
LIEALPSSEVSSETVPPIVKLSLSVELQLCRTTSMLSAKPVTFGFGCVVPLSGHARRSRSATPTQHSEVRPPT